MKRSYLPLVLVSCLSLAIAAAAFTWLVDPYGLYRPVSEQSLSRIDQFKNMRTTKPLLINSTKPDAIIIGSSRAGRIRTDHPAFASSNAYNLSIPGITLYELLELVQYSHKKTPLKSLVIGLDFNAFLPKNPKQRTGFNSQILNASGPYESFLRLQAHASTLVSTRAITNAIYAYKAAPIADVVYHPDGSWQTLGNKFTGIAGFALVARRFMETHDNGAGPQYTDTSYFRDLLDFCYSNNINTYLIIMPVHVFQLEVFKAIEVNQLWQQWHRQLVQDNQAIAGHYKKSPYPIWAFNAAKGIVDENIMKPKNAGDAWFKDAIHFRPEFGALMLDDVLPSSDQNRPIYGMKLDENNVDGYLSSVEKLQDAFLSQYPEKVAKLKDKLDIQ